MASAFLEEGIGIVFKDLAHTVASHSVNAQIQFLFRKGFPEILGVGDCRNLPIVVPARIRRTVEVDRGIVPEIHFDPFGQFRPEAGRNVDPVIGHVGCIDNVPAVKGADCSVITDRRTAARCPDRFLEDRTPAAEHKSLVVHVRSDEVMWIVLDDPFEGERIIQLGITGCRTGLVVEPGISIAVRPFRKDIDHSDAALNGGNDLHRRIVRPSTRSDRDRPI